MATTKATALTNVNLGGIAREIALPVTLSPVLFFAVGTLLGLW